MGCEDVSYSKTRQLYFLSEVCGTGKKSGRYLHRFLPGTENMTVTVMSTECRRCVNQSLRGLNINKMENPVHNSVCNVGDGDMYLSDLLTLLINEGFKDV